MNIQLRPLIALFVTAAAMTTNIQFANANGIRYSVWDTSYTTENSGRVHCRVEFNNQQGRYILNDGSVGYLYNVRFQEPFIYANWSYRGHQGVVRFHIRNSDTQMAGVWGYVPNQDRGLWEGHRIDANAPIP